MSGPSPLDNPPVAWLTVPLWRGFASLFRLDLEPPSLPVGDTERIEQFHPSKGWLRLRLLEFWIVLVVIDGIILGGWYATLYTAPMLGALLAPFALALAVLPDVVAYLAIYLRYYNTWYVLSDRSLRIRSGAWTVKELTFTYENVQNVTLYQGPLQRIFGFADLIVQTAGGGASGSSGHEGTKGGASLHEGRIAGVDRADEIRELIVRRAGLSRTAGLGDDAVESQTSPPFSDAHIAVLREIRDAVRTLAG